MGALVHREAQNKEMKRPAWTTHRKIGRSASGIFSQEKDGAHKWPSFLGRLSGRADRWTDVKLLPPCAFTHSSQTPCIFPVQFQYHWYHQMISDWLTLDPRWGVWTFRIFAIGAVRKGIKHLPLKLWNVWGAARSYLRAWGKNTWFSQGPTGILPASRIFPTLLTMEAAWYPFFHEAGGLL